MAILLTLVLLVCNLAHCGRRIVVDARNSQREQAAFGLLAFCGAFLALILMSWATFTSLSQL
ncbi:hypothetical protein [Sphingomonas sp. 8AM]|uniref:hypothetical protein n=1 Tax=Sphingomonas sp. 8AM TaxID=2653170 RepID=UPI00135A1355|nr:hypothetical protein [Sphingomonas sp. 8AM]